MLISIYILLLYYL